MLIFGSGDIWEAADIFRMLAYTSVAAVAVARGCIGNPWIFRQAREMLAGAVAGTLEQTSLTGPTLAEQRNVLEDHFTLALAVNSVGTSTVSQQRRAELYTGKTMRKFGIRFAAHHPRADEVRRRMIAISSLDDWRTVLDEFYTGDEVDAHAPEAAIVA
jgi:tRNA-dihydrouridine synthase